MGSSFGAAPGDARQGAGNPRSNCHEQLSNCPRREFREWLPALLADRPYRRYSSGMRPLRYSINVTLDGCCDHREMFADEDLHRHAVENIEQADALLFGRVTYEMMEAAWRPAARTGVCPDWMADWGLPFARTIDAAKKYVVSSTLDRVDWNAELVRGDLGTAVQQLKQEPGNGLFVGGVKLPLALAELGLIDEYELVVHPRLAGHGPTLFAGLSKPIDLRLVSRVEFGSGAVAMRYEPRR
jgi:dihydrofolate reductase